MEDGFIDPASGVLRNLLGITDAVKLQEVEASYAQIQLVQYLENPPQSLRLDAAGLQQIHHQLFQDVYPWAGELRDWGSYQSQKDFGGQTMNYASYQTLPAHLNALGEHLAADLQHLRQLPAEQFVERAAYHFDQYNYAHGFREGNGRTLAVAFTLLAEASGQKLDFLSQPAKAYNKARDYAILRPDGDATTDLVPLRDYFARISVPQVNPQAPRLGPLLQLPPKPPILVRAEVMREVQQAQEPIWRALINRNEPLRQQILSGTKKVVLADENQAGRLAALREGAEQILNHKPANPQLSSLHPSNVPPGPAAQQAAQRLLRALPLLSVLVVALAPRLAVEPAPLPGQPTARQSPSPPTARPEQPTTRRRPRL